MKKAISLLLSMAIVISFTACSGNTGSGNSSQATPSSTEAPSTTDAAAPAEPAADVTLNVLSHTYAALEYYAGELKDDAPEGVTVDVEMTNYSDWQEKMRLNLASGAASYDITYITPQDIAEFASNGWLEPLDDYVEKYREEYNFDDIPQYLWDAYSYDGHIYGIPSHQWAMIMFYRSDLMEEANVEIPATLDDLVAAAETLNKDGRSGIVMTLQASDLLMVTYQSILTACNGWFWDDQYNPTFSSKESLQAIDYISKLYEYTPADSSSYTNNEAAVAMCQDLSNMALLQTTRSGSMSDPAQSIVVGKVDFASAPSLTADGTSAAIWNTAGYSICKSTANDIETSFLTIANATDTESAAGGVDSSMPCRESALTDALLAERSDYAAAWKAIQSGATLRPTIPEFNEIMEVSMKALSAVLTGQKDATTAMAEVDVQVKELFEEAGYYN